MARCLRESKVRCSSLQARSLNISGRRPWRNTAFRAGSFHSLAAARVWKSSAYSATPLTPWMMTYCSILYLKPKMQIILQDLDVETLYFPDTLAMVHMDTYKPACYKKGTKIIFGFNTKSKEHYGLMMYHNNRLIKAYERVPCQRKANNTGEGVIGVIECDYLKPTHNKQDFDDTEEYRNTMTNVSKKLKDYWKDYCYDWTGTVKDTVERKQKLQQENRRHVMQSSNSPSNNFSAQDNSLSTFSKRKKKSLDLSQENPEKKKARGKGFDKNMSDISTSAMFKNACDANKGEHKDIKTAPKNESKDVIDKSMMKKEESKQITQTSFEDQQNYKALYVQVMEAIKHLQDKLRELKKELKKEGVDPKMNSLEYEKCTLLNSCESLQKDLEEMKTENVEVSVEDYAAPSIETSNPGTGKESLLQIWKDETQERSGNKRGHDDKNMPSPLRLKELRQRVTCLLATMIPPRKLEWVIDEILTQVMDEISPRGAAVLTKGAEFQELPSSFEEGREEENCSISPQHPYNSHPSSVTDVFIPELAKHCADSGAYRFLCSHAGQFHCKLTNLVFEMKGKCEVLYKIVPWDNSLLQGMDQFHPAGPLYNIDCSKGSILHLHLPHCEIHTAPCSTAYVPDENQIELSVAHFSEGNVEIIQPLEVTNTHVIIKVQNLSPFGLLKKWFFPEMPISAQVLLFSEKMEAVKKLHIHLLPNNVPVKEVQNQHEGDTYIKCSSKCQLTPGEKYRPLCEPYVSQPKVQTFSCDFGPNYHPIFEVILDPKVKDLTLSILDEIGQEVWEPRRVFLPAASREAVPVRIDQGAEFVDKHRDTLIQKVSSVMEIADTLLTKNIIRKENYSEIFNASTSQEKMRILYRCLDSGGMETKAEFYRLVKKKEPFLVHDLESRSNNA
ncbi:uncharacterized protein LOC132891662 isoform X2 [Neoarius graeffei]|uniref:uncharacterized protein LOC132891662 isoform X2 n=1 Tax=Neoarius graeffei TaxID=443677 RepID=UPI00298C1A54|nr:uncharacterized protein LOC132891662 isoform X2 [Neoarius graeffei]XP_060785445.1 uncharacterized protein LOC132891662 isoform X2 [Neoarius graeffei]